MPNIIRNAFSEHAESLAGDVINYWAMRERGFPEPMRPLLDSAFRFLDAHKVCVNHRHAGILTNEVSAAEQSARDAFVENCLSHRERLDLESTGVVPPVRSGDCRKAKQAMFSNSWCVASVDKHHFIAIIQDIEQNWHGMFRTPIKDWLQTELPYLSESEAKAAAYTYYQDVVKPSIKLPMFGQLCWRWGDTPIQVVLDGGGGKTIDKGKSFHWRGLLSAGGEEGLL